MSDRLTRTVGIVLVSWVAAVAWAQEETSAADQARAALAGFDSFVEQAIVEWNVPGQPKLTLVPDLSGRFVLKEVATASIGFEVDESGNVTGAKLYLPDGVHELPPVEE